jgi:UDP-glucose 4-epimerase
MKKQINMNKSKILITGGAGFIGSHLTEALLKKGHQVTVLDDFSTGRKRNLEAVESKINLVKGSVLQKKTVKSLIEEADIIYHLAAAVGVKYVIENPLKSLEINIKGSENVLESAYKCGNKTVLMASTSEVYGKNDKVPLKEDDDRLLGSTYISRWGYSDSKAIDELLSLAYFREKGLPVIITRFFNICGPRQVGNYGMVLPRFVKQAMSNQDISVFGDGNQTRCFCYVGDLIGTLVKLPFYQEAYGEIFNIGSNREISIKKLAELVIKVTGSSSRIIFVPYEKAYQKGFEDMHRRVPSIEKINKLTGFTPRVDLEIIIRKVMQYFQKEALHAN